MKRRKKITQPVEELKVLVVGNNPIELGYVFKSLEAIPGKGIITEIAFDLKSIVERLGKFTPTFILLDDNIGKLELKEIVQGLLKFRKTRRVPITVLKNSNYVEAINSGVVNYILKKNITGESLCQAFKSSLKFKQTQRYLLDAYRKRKNKVRLLLS